MLADSLTETLHKHPFVSKFPPPMLDRLAALATEVRFEPDQIVFREGEDKPEFYLIISGRLALEIAAGSDTLRIQTLSAGDEFGWSAVLPGRGKHLQARALETVDTLAFRGADLLDACQRDPSFGFILMHRMLDVVSERLEATRLQLLDMYWPAAKRAGT
jgi:CRP/FNR family cyclic AMP-dependent transcriptional regulator